jgi:hypothetical protein
MKRTRTPFTDLQVLELENYFKTNKFLTAENSHLLIKWLRLSKEKNQDMASKQKSERNS